MSENTSNQIPSAAEIAAETVKDVRSYLAGELDELEGEVGIVTRARIYLTSGGPTTWVELDFDGNRVEAGRVVVAHGENQDEHELTAAEVGEIADAYGLGAL